MQISTLIAPARPLPVLILADVSTSMDGDKIARLNSALCDMITQFQHLETARAHLHVGIVTFSSNAQEHTPLAPAEQIRLEPLKAGGLTAMGAAFSLAREMLEDSHRVPARSWLPTLVLISDGQPNDNWEAPLHSLLESPRAARATRLAVGIGNDCDFSVLRRFVAHPEIPVVRAHELSTLDAFFRFVTFSTMSRSRARDPNVSPLPLHMLQDDDLLF